MTYPTSGLTTQVFYTDGTPSREVDGGDSNFGPPPVQVGVCEVAGPDGLTKSQRRIAELEAECAALVSALNETLTNEAITYEPVAKDERKRAEALVRKYQHHLIL